MANLRKIYIGAVCNRDLKVLENIKEFLKLNYNISIINLLKNNIESFDPNSFKKRLKKYPISFLIVKLTTQKSNKNIYKVIRNVSPNIPILNSLSSVQICESRTNTFNLIKNACKKIQIPLTYNTKQDAWKACQEGTNIIVKLDSHNIPALPKKDRIIGIARNSNELGKLIENYKECDLFFQEYLGEHDIIYKVYVIGNWVVSITSYNRLQKNKDLSPLELIHIRVPVDERFKRRIIRLGRNFGMSIFGLDYIMTEKGPYIVDVNDFPSFRSIPEGVSLVSDHIYNLINMREIYQNTFIRAKS